MAEEEDFSGLPLNEKLAHKNWKARILGYEELTKKLSKLEENSPEYSKLGTDFKKYVVDTNPAAMEKAIETTIAFFESAPTNAAQKIVPDVIVGIIAKCLSGRTNTKKLSILVCLYCIEVDQQDCVMEELIKGWTNKVVKVAAAAINATTCCLTEFGIKIFNIKSILKALPAPYASTDKTIRIEIKTLSAELTKWLKVEPVRASLKDLKPGILKELEEDWAKIDPTPPNPTRLLRSQQNIQPEVSDDKSDDDAVEAPPRGAEASFDPLSLIDPEDLLKKLPENFYTDIVSVKWKERSDALNEAAKIAEETPKFIASDYTELMKTLLKILVKDSNINCAMSSAKLVTFIAKGLKKNFHPYSNQMLAAGLEKLKDKKPQVVTTLREFCDAIYQTSTLQDLKEVILPCFENKNPNAKAELCLFLERSFCYCTPAIFTKPLIKDFVPNLVKKVEDTVPEVRVGASQALAVCIKVIGKRNMGTYLDGVEKNKLAKVEEYVNEVVLKVPQGTTSAPTNKVTKKAAPPAPKIASNPAPAKQEEQNQTKTTTTKNETKLKTSTTTKQSTGNKTKTKETAKKNTIKDDAIRFDNEPNATPEDMHTMATELFGEEIIALLGDAKWKDRINGCEKVKDILEETNPADVCAQVYLHALSISTGLKDGNLQALNAKFSVIALLIPKCSSWGEKCCEITIGPLSEKLGEIKLKTNAIESLFCIVERIGSLNHVANIVLETTMKNKSPKFQSEGLLWLSAALDIFGLVIQPKPFIEFIKTAISGTNPVVRESGIKLLTCFAKFFGAKADMLKNLLGDFNPALEPKIDGAISAGKSSEIPKSSRFLKPTGGATGGGEGEEAGVEQSENTMNTDDLIERVDISGRLTSVISGLNNQKWQVRNEALEELKQLLQENPSITPNLGDLPACLKARMDEKNRNIAMYALNNMTTLAENLGPGCNKHAKIFVASAYSVLGDQKPHIKKAALDMLDAWHQQVKLYACLENDLAMAALKIPAARADFFDWLNSKLKDGVPGKLPKTELLNLIPILGESIEDKAMIVRDKSKLVLLSIAELIGKDCVLKAAAKCKPGQVSTSIGKVLKSVSDSVPVPANPPPATNPPTNASKTQENSSGNGTSNKITSGQKSVAPKTTVAVPEPPAVLFKMGQTREQREAEEKRFGSTKCPRWDFDKQAFPTPAHIKYLKDHMLLCIDQEIIDKLMHKDPLEQSKAIRNITRDHLKNYEEEILNCYDLILKWITFRLVENNTTLLIDCIEFLKATVPILSERNSKLSESEANSFLPFFVNKLGNPKETIRKDLGSLIHSFCQIYPPHKLYSFISVGLISRNSKMKLDCIEFLGEIICEHGTGACTPTPQKAIESLARCISENDHKTKNAALICMVYVYNHIGDQLYKYVGFLPPRDKELLNDKIEKSGVKNAKSSPQPPSSAGNSRPPSTLGQSRDNSLLTTDNNNNNMDLPRSNQSSSEDILKDIVREEELHTNTEKMESSPPASDIPQQSTKQQHVDPETHKLVDETTIITHSLPMDTTPRYSGPFKIQPDLALQQYKLQEVTPTSKLKKPSPQLDSILQRPTITTSYQTSRLRDRTQYANEISNIIKLMASDNLSKVCQESRKMEQILKMQPHKLIEHLSQLIRAIAMKVNTFSNLLSDNKESDELMDAMRAIMSCLQLICSHRVLGKRIQYDCLKDLLAEMVKLILRSGATKQEGPEFVLSLNFIIAKILENCDQNMLYKVLLVLMLKCLVPNDNYKPAIDIYMKCLWRLTRTLNTNIKLIKVSELLYDVDQFFIGYHKLGLSPTPEDQVHKTVKTIVFHIAIELGQDVWNYTDKLSCIETSYTCSFLRKTLNRQNTKNNESNNMSNLDKTKYSPSKLESSNVITPAARFREQLSRCLNAPDTANTEKPEVNQKLAQIFTRIGSRDVSKQGLSDLYEFMLSFPTADLSPFLKNTSNIFQSYIERGLQSIENEIRVQDSYTNPRIITHNSISEIGNSYTLLRDNAYKIMGLSLDKLELKSPQTLNNTSYHSNRQQQQQYTDDNSNNKPKVYNESIASYGQESNINSSTVTSNPSVSNQAPATTQVKGQNSKDAKLEELRLKYANICSKQNRN